MVYCRFTKSRGPPNLGNQRVEKSASPMFGKVCCGLNFDKLALQLWNLQPRSSVWLAFPLLLADTFTDSSKEMESSSWIIIRNYMAYIVGTSSLVSVLAFLCSQGSPGDNPASSWASRREFWRSVTSTLFCSCGNQEPKATVFQHKKCHAHHSNGVDVYSARPKFPRSTEDTEILCSKSSFARFYPFVM